MMPSGERRYGVQVGNETYSLVITQEDWEKRKLDRERERKLTLETNRRRKALEDKKKLANERESRKRELELAKRRQRQIEATERYQRSHSATRDRQNYIIGNIQNTPTVEAVLHQLRSGDAVSNVPSEPDYVGSANSVETGKYKFETELEEQKNKILENHRKKTMQEFSEQLHSTGEHQSRSIPKPSGAFPVTQGDATRSQGTPYSHSSVHDGAANNSDSRQPPSYSYSNVDIMSGRTYASFIPMSPWPNVKAASDRGTTTRNDMPNPSAEPKTLAESLSRLFVGHQTPTHTESGDKSVQNYSSNGLKLEEADEVIQDSLDYSNAKNIDQPKENGKADDTAHATKSKDYNANDFAHNMYYEHEDGAAFDDQDSLHGSTSSGTSPRPGSYTTTNEGPTMVGHSTINTTPTESNGRATLGSQLFRSREAGLPNKFSFKPAEQDVIASDSKSVLTKDSKPAPAVPAQTHIVANPVMRNEHHAPNEGPKTPISYYIKAYRPWSASMSEKQPSQTYNTSSMIRPGSADLSQRSASADGRYVRAQTKTSATNFRPVEQQTSKTEMSKSDPPVEPKANKWATNVPAKTTATPISAMYSVPWEADNSSNVSSRSVVLLARQAIPESPSVKVSEPSEVNTAKPSPSTEARPSPQTSAISLQNGDVGPNTESSSKPVFLKGILRRGSKYDRPASTPSTHYSSLPAYQSAGVARQKWVNGINVSPSQGSKLKGVEIRDSLEMARKSVSTTESEPKSVRWHQVQYNDGTTSALDNLEDGVQKMLHAPPSPVVVPQKLSAPRVAAPKTPKPRPPSAAKGKSPAPPKGGKAAKGKNGRGRKLKPAKEAPTEIEPHPPEKKTKQLSMSTVVNYSIDGEESSHEARDSKDENNNKAPPSPSTVGKPPVSPMRNKIMFHQRGRVAWEAPDLEEAVTMDTLKSAGNMPQRNGDYAGGNVVVNQSNQVTIHVVSPEKTAPSKNQFKGTHNHSPISLNRTPTDQEINWLWDKVRACLSQNKASNGSPMLRKSNSDTGRQNVYARKGAWSAAQSTSGGQQTSANIISIDGGVLGGHDRNNVSAGPRVKGKRGGRRLMRPSSAIMMQSSIQRQATDAYNSYIQRHGLLQRRQKQLRGQRADGVKSATYPSPRASMYPPTPPASADHQSAVSDSMATFLLAETLAEQNIPEEQILQALESLQRKTKEAQRLGRQMLPSSLSMEEQKLLMSLERLNTRLQEVQANNPYANHSLVPSQTAWTDYSHVPDTVPLPYSSGRGRTASADSVYRTSRIRY